MMTFRQFYQSRMNEGLVGKAAVAGYALQGKRHGDAAVRQFNNAKTALKQSAVPLGSKSNGDVATLKTAISQMLDGLISMRLQIGSVSAQITSQSTL